MKTYGLEGPNDGRTGMFCQIWWQVGNGRYTPVYYKTQGEKRKEARYLLDDNLLHLLTNFSFHTTTHEMSYRFYTRPAQVNGGMI